MFILFLVVVAAIALGAVALYNGLVRKRNLVGEGWSGIDVQLKRRADLVQNLVNTVKGYGKHEKEVIENVTTARANAVQAKGVEAQAKAESTLTGALRTLFAVSENYPDLKASTNFLELQKALAAIEDEIQLARRYYNGTARDLNTAIQSFPAVIFAPALGFKAAPFFELESVTDRKTPDVQF
jgi:LemA protein